MREGHKIGVVIPAFNEAGAIAKVLADIPDWVDLIVVADNGSTDATSDIARSCGADVTLETESGYGAACLAGIKCITDHDIIVFLDGDYSDYPDQMKRLVDPIVAGTADLVIGSRRRGQVPVGALTLQQKFGNWLACRLIKLFWGVTYTDLGPFRAVRAVSLEELGMQDRAFGWTVEMQLKAILKNLNILEVPTDYRARIGHSKISGTVRGTILAGHAILGTIAKTAWRERKTLRARFNGPALRP